MKEQKVKKAKLAKVKCQVHKTVDLVFLYFTFHFYFYSVLFFYFLFLEQLGLGWISYVITSVTI